MARRFKVRGGPLTIGGVVLDEDALTATPPKVHRRPGLTPRKVEVVPWVTPLRREVGDGEA